MELQPRRNPLVPHQGERVLLCGQTGSGKTGLACWLLRRIEQSPVIIYDTKIDEKFRALPFSTVVESWNELLEAVERAEHDYIIMRPHVNVVSDPELLDKHLLYHYNHLHGTVVYIDEVTQFHQNGRIGPGFLSVLTRGRSRGITTIMSTQRPSWISRSCLTEAQRFFILRLKDKRDSKVFDAVIEDFSHAPKAPKHWFYYENDGEENLRLFRPIKLDEGIDKGYIDAPSDGTEANPDPSTVKPHRLANAHWI